MIANTVLHAAGCFSVEIGATRFGITAFRVIAAFLADCEKHPGVYLMVRSAPIENWDARFIDGNPIPATTKDLSGYSGSPLLVVSAKPLASIFWLGGVVFSHIPEGSRAAWRTAWMMISVSATS
jgi:hypothetical protein